MGGFRGKTQEERKRNCGVRLKEPGHRVRREGKGKKKRSRFVALERKRER
jgi:hypothetical protein